MISGETIADIKAAIFLPLKGNEECLDYGGNGSQIGCTCPGAFIEKKKLLPMCNKDICKYVLKGKGCNKICNIILLLVYLPHMLGYGKS